MTNAPAKQRTAQWFLKVVTTVLVLGGVLFAGLEGYARIHEGLVFPGVTVAGIPVGRMDRATLERTLTQATSVYYTAGIPFRAESSTTYVYPIARSIDDPDLTYEIIHFDIEDTIDAVWGVGRSGNLLSRYSAQWRARATGIDTLVAVEVDAESLEHELKEKFVSRLQPARSAQFEISGSSITTTKEQQGVRFDFASAAGEVEKSLQSLGQETIAIERSLDIPEVSQAEATQLIPALEQVLALGDITLTHEEDSWSIPGRVFKTWITPGKVEGVPALTLDLAKAEEYLKTIALVFDQPARDARFELEDGKVVEFSGSAEGRAIYTEQTINNLEQSVLQSRQTEAELAVQVLLPATATGDVNDLGVTEIIGVGTSEFAGSSGNRRTNIAVGAAALDGLLIAPGEEFSMVKVLGNIDADNGYKQEMVIKGDKTIPEYGGGLCQIGTTAFRAALASGLEITERRNHSYRVRYYEPAGTDATIYGPHPDFRFLNDTGNHILIQTRVEGDKAIFEFWGTSDGRIAKTTEPKIYNFIDPPPTKLIETLDLPPGEKKCTEHAKQGATAEFTYTITQADGTEKEEVFKSYYRPWQEVCLIGVEELSEEVPADETDRM